MWAPTHGLQARAVTKTYQRGDERVVALRDVSLVFPDKQLAAIVGPSGSGKSTLMHLLGGLDRPTSGSVLLDGIPLEGRSDRELAKLRRRRVGFVFQFFNLVPTLTAEQNVAMPLLLDGAPADEVRAKARALLGLVGLRSRADHRPHQLSGGEMQRVAIARALVSDPAVVLADEPTGNLDSARGAEILGLLRRAVEERGCTMIVVTHDEAVAARADRVVVLRDACIAADQSSLTSVADGRS